MKRSNDRHPPQRGAVADLGRRRFMGAAATLPLCALAAACGLEVPGQRPPPNLYRLTPKNLFSEDLPSVDWQLAIDVPNANASLNSTRVALQRQAIEIEYYAKASWSDRLPLMIQSLVIESFENSAKIVSVGRQSTDLRADYLLKTDIREFQAEYFEASAGAAPSVHVRINAKLVQMPRRVIVDQSDFEARIAATSDRIEEIITAFDEALGKTLKRLVEWTITTGESKRRRS